MAEALPQAAQALAEAPHALATRAADLGRPNAPWRPIANRAMDLAAIAASVHPASRPAAVAWKLLNLGKRPLPWDLEPLPVEDLLPIPASGAIPSLWDMIDVPTGMHYVPGFNESIYCRDWPGETNYAPGGWNSCLEGNYDGFTYVDPAWNSFSVWKGVPGTLGLNGGHVARYVRNPGYDGPAVAPLPVMAPTPVPVFPPLARPVGAPAPQPRPLHPQAPRQVGPKPSEEPDLELMPRPKARENVARAPLPWRVHRPPGRRVLEKKFSPIGQFGILLAKALGSLSEVGDAADVLLDALPKYVRRRFITLRRKKGDQLSLQTKLRFIWKYRHSLDFDKVIDGLIENHFEDKVVGAFQRAGNAKRITGAPINLGFGPGV